MRSFASASRASVRPAWSASFIMAQLPQDLQVLELDHRLAMKPLGIAFEQPRTAALRGVRDDHGGPVLRAIYRREGRGELTEIVAVALDGVPAERAPLVRHRRDGHRIGFARSHRVAPFLELVGV